MTSQTGIDGFIRSGVPDLLLVAHAYLGSYCNCWDFIGVSELYLTTIEVAKSVSNHFQNCDRSETMRDRLLVSYKYPIVTVDETLTVFELIRGIADGEILPKPVEVWFYKPRKDPNKVR
jgi:hypothetical protein